MLNKAYRGKDSFNVNNFSVPFIYLKNFFFYIKNDTQLVFARNVKNFSP